MSLLESANALSITLINDTLFIKRVPRKETTSKIFLTYITLADFQALTGYFLDLTGNKINSNHSVKSNFLFTDI